MFQSVIDQQGWNTRRLGAGAGVSVLLHAGILGAVLVLSAGVAEQVDKEPVVVVFKRPPPRGTPIPPAAMPAVAQPPQPPKPKKKLTVPAVVPTQPPPETAPLPEEPPAPPTLPFIPGGSPDGTGEATACKDCLPSSETVTEAVEEPREEVLPFVSGNMTPPSLVSGAPLEYTREALAARVAGMLIARCVITREGEVENCRVLKGLPHMSDAVVSALETRRYTPVQYQGRPISVIYNFRVKLDLPR